MSTDTAHTHHHNFESDGVLSRAAVQLRQFMCGLHGHDTLKHFAHGRISLLCASCGYESPGWEVKGPARGDRDAVRIAPLPLVGERRAA